MKIIFLFILLLAAVYIYAAINLRMGYKRML
jgi:hypothetical protein